MRRLHSTVRIPAPFLAHAGLALVGLVPVGLATLGLAFLGLVAIGLVPVGVASAQPVLDQDVPMATELVSWQATAQPEVIGPGGSALITIDGTIGEGWKMYALDSVIPRTSSPARPIGVTIAWTGLPDGVTAEPNIGQTTPLQKHDPIFDLDVAWFVEGVTFFTALTASDSAAAGGLSASADVRFQICNDDMGLCLPPAVMAVPVALDIDPSCSDCGASPDDLEQINSTGMSDEGSAISQTSDYESFRRGGLFPFLMLAIGAGLLSLLTPCVFPMIPLTVSYFMKHSDNRARAARMATLFGAAIVITFTGLGIVMALVVGAAGAQTIAANPWVNLMIAAVLVGFALSLLGLYEIRLPSVLLNRVNRQSTGGGVMGVLFMGLTLTLVSFSCTAPFVGGLLAAAAGGTWVFPLFGMVAYSATFALPFVLFALFPGALDSLPRSGTWMSSMKVVLGFIELAAAVKFLSNADLVWGLELISRPLGIAFVLVVFVLTGMYLLGKLHLPHQPPMETVGVGRLFASMAFFILAIYMLPGLLGAPLNSLDAYLPPRKGTDISILGVGGQPGQAQVVADESWHVDDIEAALAEGRERGVPVFVDFTGWSCTNCRDMEANVFPVPEVARRLKEQYALLKLYTDGMELGTDFQRYQLRLTGTVALPTYAVISPVDEKLLARRSGTMKTQAFVEFLDEASRLWSGGVAAMATADQ